jgi:ribonuclease PH
MNVVMTDGGKFVEVQATAEGRPFEKHLLDSLIRLAEQGIRKLIAAQKDAIQRGTHS